MATFASLQKVVGVVSVVVMLVVMQAAAQAPAPAPDMESASPPQLLHLYVLTMAPFFISTVLAYFFL